MNIATTPNSLENQWLPFTPNRAFKKDPRLLAGAKGVYYHNQRGDKLLDSSSGLFCCALGHGRQEITDAVSAQIAEMDYNPPFQYANAQSFELARMITDITPEPMNHVFFTNSGSESIDTALKMALMYHRVKGQSSRQRFVGRERGYHGVNFGGMSVQGMVKNKEAFGTGLPGVVHMRHTHIDENRMKLGQGEHGADLANDLQRFVDLYGADSIAACVVEPIAGSTGILVPPVGYLQRLREICDQHGILLIFDEVICGFGRTGEAFGSQAFGVTPDIMTLAKALTNGAIPMGAVVVRDEIYESIVEATPEGGIEFFHGYTYSAHPVACAAGLATQKIYRDEGIFEQAKGKTGNFMAHVEALKDISSIVDLRAYGLLAGIDLEPSPDGPGKRGAALIKECFEKGMVVRAGMDTIMVSPPLVINEDEMDQMFGILRDVIKSV